MSTRRDPVEVLAGPLYLFALTLVVAPALQTLIGTWPPRLGEVGWRFGTVGVVTGAFQFPSLGVLLASALAVRLGHVRPLRLLRVALWVAIPVLALVTVIFVLDAVQLRATLQPEARRGFELAVVQALTVQGLLFCVFVWVAIRLPRLIRSTGSAAESAGRPGVVLPGPSSPPAEGTEEAPRGAPRGSGLQSEPDEGPTTPT